MKSRKKIYRQVRSDSSKRVKRVSGKTGLPPGSLVHIGKVLTESVTISITEYNEKDISQKTIGDLKELIFTDNSVNRWIEITGLQETDVIASFGKQLNISPLVLEDIVNTEHRPKLDIQDGMLFMTLKAYYLSEEHEIRNEQASFILGEGFLASFQESDHNWFDPVKSLLVNATGKIRQRGLDFLLYSLIDVIVDQYYAVVEDIGDQLEDLEDLIFARPSQELLEKNRLIKKEIITIRKALVPALEAMNKLKRDEPEMIGKEIMNYYDDVHDHIIQILDYIDTYRELSAELKENYLSNITLRMNQVMKLLTIITSIFIPLTFIVGIYGMNFRFMPELEWKYGYFAVLGAMLVLVIGMLVYFRRRKWL